MSLHVTLLYPQWGTRKRLYGVCVRSVLLSGCQAVSAAVRPLCAVGLSGSCQAVTLGPDSDGSPRLSGSAVRLSDTCCQTVRESAVSAVRLSGTVRRCPGFAVRLSDQGSDNLVRETVSDPKRMQNLMFFHTQHRHRHCAPLSSRAGRETRALTESGGGGPPRSYSAALR